MMHSFETTSTPWRRGPFREQQRGLTFGTMYEDSSIELRAFNPRSRVFCIAGAGCTARTLAAAGHDVTAVDISPLQLAYAKSRAAGDPPQMGTVERLMALGREFATLVGWSRRKLEDFLNLSNPAEQLEYWDHRLDTRIWRVVVDTLLTPHLLGLCYSDPFIEPLPRDFGKRLRHRLRRGWASHCNRRNPYAASLLLGTPPVEPGAPESPINFVCADAADFLESCLPASFDAFALSNIGDGAPSGYLRRLHAAMEHAAAYGAVVVSRTFAEPSDTTTANWAALDRSLLWGVVEVNRIEGGKPCSIC
jgi:S-adenosylmethionine:diacylglycerol 3-amino-3-carboxypropyl transferase